VLRVALYAGAALAAATCYRVATRSLILGSAEGGWQYGYVADVSVWPVLGIALVAIAFVVTLMFATRRIDEGREWPQVLSWVVAAFVVQLLVRPVAPFPLGTIFASDGANAFYGVSRRLAPADILTPTRSMRTEMPLHAQSNMPGKPLLTSAMRTLSSRPAAISFAIAASRCLRRSSTCSFRRDCCSCRS
jgi:hypothetical protein